MRADRSEEPRAEESAGENAEAAEQEGAGAPAAEADDGASPGPAGTVDAAEAEALRDRYLRLAAEYENYRKRTDRERTELWARAQAQLVEKLLDPLDDLQRVAHYSPETTRVEALLEGVQIVERKLLRVLENAGLELIEAHGEPFDPAEHEALMTAVTQEREEDDTVGEVFQKGYRFRGELLRPARVQVRKHEG